MAGDELSSWGGDGLGCKWGGGWRRGMEGGRGVDAAWVMEGGG